MPSIIVLQRFVSVTLSEFSSHLFLVVEPANLSEDHLKFSDFSTTLCIEIHNCLFCAVLLITWAGEAVSLLYEMNGFE